MARKQKRKFVDPFSGWIDTTSTWDHNKVANWRRIFCAFGLNKVRSEGEDINDTQRKLLSDLLEDDAHIIKDDNINKNKEFIKGVVCSRDFWIFNGMSEKATDEMLRITSNISKKNLEFFLKNRTV